jgi:hypothetical protein
VRAARARSPRLNEIAGSSAALASDVPAAVTRAQSKMALAA